MKTFLLSVLFFFLFQEGNSQNLVHNPSLEDKSGCPTYLAQLYRADFWSSPTNTTPEYYNECVATVVSIPGNQFGLQYARTGQAYAGIYIYKASFNYREYIQVELTAPLIAGNCYHFEMFVNLGETSALSIDQMGAYFSVPKIQSLQNTMLNVTPQIVGTAGDFLDYILWKSVSGNYIALGGEKFIIIGNFKDDLITTGISLPGPHPTSGPSYCFVDDVSLTPCSVLPIELFNFSSFQKNNSIELTWTTASETNNDYFIIEKSKDSEIFSEINKIDGAGNSTLKLNYKFIDDRPFDGVSYYRLKQVDFDGKFSYSKIIDVNFSFSKTQIRIEPNPAFTETIIYFPEELKGETKIELFNSQGKTVLTIFENKEMSSYLLNLETLEKGIYFISIENKEQHFNTKLIVT